MNTRVWELQVVEQRENQESDWEQGRTEDAEARGKGEYGVLRFPLYICGEYAGPSSLADATPQFDGLLLLFPSASHEHRRYVNAKLGKGRG
jgi:hypothetical protein